MKKILILLLACAALTACEDNNNKVQLDPYSSITLNGTAAPALNITKAQFKPPYTIQTVAKYAWDMALTTPELTGSRGLSERDIAAGKLKVGQTNEVVAEDGSGGYELGWMVSGLSDVLCRATFKANNHDEWWISGDGTVSEGTGPSGIMDTIAYVPNAVIRKAEKDIKAAFDAGNYELCMTLFETAYTFVPITGAQWRKLKADGIE